MNKRTLTPAEATLVIELRAQGIGMRRIARKIGASAAWLANRVYEIERKEPAPRPAAPLPRPKNRWPDGVSFGDDEQAIRDFGSPAAHRAPTLIPQAYS